MGGGGTGEGGREPYGKQPPFSYPATSLSSQLRKLSLRDYVPCPKFTQLISLRSWD